MIEATADVLAARIAGIELDPDPWPHATLDGFFPPQMFAELLDRLPSLGLADKAIGRKKTDKGLPASVSELLHSEAVLGAIRERFRFDGGKVMLEVSWFGADGLSPHVDRADKLWNGQVYLAGDPKGTELYGPGDKLARVLEWQPNRFTCWPPPKAGLKHAAPQSKGRYVLLYWILQEQRSRAERKAWKAAIRAKNKSA